MNTRTLLIGGTLGAIGVVTTAALALSRTASAAELPPGEPPLENDDWSGVLPLPTEADVPGADLETNWGTTPVDLRPLFALMERASRIPGAGRIFAVISVRESIGFDINARNASDREVIASCRAYVNRRGNNPKLKYGVDAALWGSGGLFGALGPYFLWTAINELKGDAPLLEFPPEAMWLPRVAAFAACVYLYRILRYYRVEDHGDIKAGWASPSLLVGSGRDSSAYIKSRSNFFGDADQLGIDLDDESTIPGPVLDWQKWPGVTAVRLSVIGPTMPVYTATREPLGEEALAPCLEKL